MGALLTLNLVVLAAIAYAAVLFIVPACMTSMFRYQLWRLRDDLVDDILAERFEATELPSRLVGDIELVIAGAKELHFRNFALLHLVTTRDDRERTQREEFDLSTLSPHDRALFEPYLSRLSKAMIRHALIGSPSGWLFTSLLFPPLLIVAIVTRVFGVRRHDRTVFERTQSQVEHEIDLEPALVLVRQRHERRSAYVQV